MATMNSKILFFATRNDLIPVLNPVENEREIIYVSTEAETPNPKIYRTVSELPELGIAPYDSAVNCKVYFMCHPSSDIKVKRVDRSCYAVDQLFNSVAFSTGGLWGKGVLLYGSFESPFGEDYASRLMKSLRGAVRKQWKKIKAYYVGEEAEKMLDSGKRLTIAAQSPREYDLSKV